MSGGAVRRESGSWLFVLLLFAFGFFGLFWGGFAVLLADLSGALSLSPGPLGFALFVGAATSGIAIVRAMRRFGSDRERHRRRANALYEFEWYCARRASRTLSTTRGKTSSLCGGR
jgi:TRAP-type C4-dicarboxylate transport system permease small subunit